jgi:hypothetical protein
VDPDVPIEEVAGVVKDLIAEGKVKSSTSAFLNRDALSCRKSPSSELDEGGEGDFTIFDPSGLSASSRRLSEPSFLRFGWLGLRRI